MPAQQGKARPASFTGYMPVPETFIYIREHQFVAVQLRSGYKLRQYAGKRRLHGQAGSRYRQSPVRLHG